MSARKRPAPLVWRLWLGCSSFKCCQRSQIRITPGNCFENLDNMPYRQLSLASHCSVQLGLRCPLNPSVSYPMPKFLHSFNVLVVFALTAFSVVAASPNKCVINGTVTYQQQACPTDQIRQPPTIQKLNVEEPRRRAGAAPSLPDKTSSSAPILSSGFRCDGRQHCSQMKSCDEAKYFLANCPGVKMDGDKNGIPCEQQWCLR